MKRKGCSHGKTFDEPCVDCRLFMARAGLKSSEESAVRYQREIDQLEEQKARENGNVL